VAWFDKRPVHILSNAYQPEGELTVEHWYPAKANEPHSINGKVKKEVPIPPAVYYYNQYMGGVDLFDQYRSYINLELRSVKFWHPMMWFLFESALVNSWVIYQQTMKQADKPTTFSHFEFRRAIALALASEWESMGCFPANSTTSPTKSFQSSHARTARLSFSISPTEDRYTCPQKHVTYKEKMPLLEGSKRPNRQMLCAYCKQKRTIYWCKKCTVPLCGRDCKCFLLFHTR
jgi:Transposase IS4